MDLIVTETDTLASRLDRSVLIEVSIGMAWHGASGLGFVYTIRGN
jgi:hypothetical protein